jgi:putative tricarboxylic transport membrane protein
VTGAARHQAAETATLAILGVLGVGVAVVGSGYGIGVDQRTGPGFLPLVAGVGLALMCAALLLTKLRGSDASDRNTAVETPDTNAMNLAGDVPEEQPNPTRNHPARLVFGGLIVTIVLVPMIGFLESFALLLMFVSVVVERRPVLPALGVTAVAVAAIYLVFVQFLSVRLPMGLLAIVGA